MPIKNLPHPAFGRIERIKSRTDEGLAALDRGQGVDGEKFMARMLNGLEAKESKRKAGKRKAG